MNPTAIADRVLALAADLRSAGVDASMAEALDAIRALAHLELIDRAVVRIGLQATLVKRPEDRDVFGVLFERHFPLTPGRGDLGAPGPAAAAGTGGRDDGVVADGGAVLRRAAAAADLDVLAAGAAHLPPPDAGAELAAPGGAARAGDLRAVGRCELERGGSDVFGRGGEARGMKAQASGRVHVTSCTSGGVIGKGIER